MSVSEEFVHEMHFEEGFLATLAVSDSVEVLVVFLPLAVSLG
jgi:hypothetical protein